MLQLFYDDFLSFVPLQLPQLLDVTTMEAPKFYDDYVLLSFPLTERYELEEVMDIFEDDMELKSSIIISRPVRPCSAAAPVPIPTPPSVRCSR